MAKRYRFSVENGDLLWLDGHRNGGRREPNREASDAGTGFKTRHGRNREDEPTRVHYRDDSLRGACSSGCTGELHCKVLAAEHATRRHDVVNRVLPLTLTVQRGSCLS